MTKRWSVTFLLVLLAFPPHARSEQPLFRLMVVQSLAATSVYGVATAINDAGLVVGHSLLASGAVHAAAWQNGRVTDLGTAGGRDSHAWGVNNLGAIVGSAQTSQGNTTAMLWSAGGVTALTGLGGANSEAYGINDAGVIVGAGNPTTPPFNAPNRPIVWKDAVPSDLGTLGGDSGGALAINAASLIAGASRTATQPYVQGALWDHGTIVNLSTPGQLDSAVRAINAIGMMAGLAEDLPFGGYYAARWQNNVIGRLPVPEGSMYSYANGINDDGAIVGQMDLSFSDRAALWIGSTVWDLNSLLVADRQTRDWRLTSANDINHVGQIVGTAYNFATGRSAAFLLTPVPEPAAALLLLAGLVVIAARVRPGGRSSAFGHTGRAHDHRREGVRERRAGWRRGS